MPLNATGRKVLSSVLKANARFEQENAVGTYFATVDCKGSGDIEPIGTLMKYSVANSAFYPMTVDDDWSASVVTALGKVVKPTTLNGFEYVCVTAGTTNDTEGEPTWPTVPGATVTETDGVEWLTQIPGGKDINSPLPDGTVICITVGAKEGVGFNIEAVTLSSSATEMSVLFRGEAAVVDGGLIYGTGVEAETNRALEMNGIVVVAAATNVVPTYL